MNDTLTSAFVERIRAIRFDALPAAALEVARQVVLDGLGVIRAGSREPLGLGRIVTEYARRMGGAPQASVIAGGFKTSTAGAAFANGCVAHALAWDDTWYPLSREQRLKKFEVCTRALLDPAVAQRVIERVERLDTLTEIAGIMDLVRCDAG